MEQSNERLSEELETTSAGLPKRYIPWIPLIALAQLLVTVGIFAAVMAPYAGHEQPVAAIHDGAAS